MDQADKAQQILDLEDYYFNLYLLKKRIMRDLEWGCQRAGLPRSWRLPYYPSGRLQYGQQWMTTRGQILLPREYRSMGVTIVVRVPTWVRYHFYLIAG